MNLKRVHLIIHGRVQGVGFRYFTHRQACALRLSGWVRNLPDGTVEALAEGSEATLAKFLDRVREGPPSSRVDNVQEAWAAAEGDNEQFTIRH